MNGDAQPDDRSRWNARYRERAASAGHPDGNGHGPLSPPSPLVRLVCVLPWEAWTGGDEPEPGHRGRVVDLAGGDGSGALYLAGRGLDPVVVDVADAGLALARSSAQARGISLQTVEQDLTGATLAEVLAAVGGPAPTVVTCFNYLERSLLASVATDLPAGCRFVAAIATITNRERNPRPSPRFLLQPGELYRLVMGADSSARLSVLHHRQGWGEDGVHRAELAVVARP